jgi:1,2-phenylacetyl-CoA epoxidase catalytic subunit
MSISSQFRVEDLPKKWQEEDRVWQENYFPEMGEVMDKSRWGRFYPQISTPLTGCVFATPDGFSTYAKGVAGATGATADLTTRVWKAERMPDAQFMMALKIIRAQASTELGSIQQHRGVYEKLDHGSMTGLDREIVEGIHNTDRTGQSLEALSFSKKRVCVEELRHHVQMAGVLTLDETFDKPRWGRHWATEVMEELLAMKPGEHVLDAFNIEFKSLLDSGTFLALIDRVGKYQLEMQHHFIYGPMAMSMPWMRWHEESYHLAAGEKLLRAIAVAAALGGGNFTLDDVQRTINMWYPRGLEMFGSELGGDLVKGVFKTLKNGEAQDLYRNEVAGKLDEINLAIIHAKTKLERKDGLAGLQRMKRGESLGGMTQKDLLFLPDRRFFRIRGLREFGDFRNEGAFAAGVGYVYLPYDIEGRLMTENGRPIDRGAYVDYLRTVLPDRYLSGRHWTFVKEEFLFNDKWGTPEPVLTP